MDLKAKLQLLQGLSEDQEPTKGAFVRLPLSVHKAIAQAKRDKRFKSIDWLLNYGAVLALLSLEENFKKQEKKGA